MNSTLLAVLAVAVLFILSSLDPRLDAAPFDPSWPYVGKSDVMFFFDQIAYDHGKWRFELSRNSMGMLWREVEGKDDLTGVCNYKEALIVPKAASLEVKMKDIGIRFQPVVQPSVPAAYIVSIRFGPDKPYNAANSSVMEMRDNGQLSFGHAEE